MAHGVRTERIVWSVRGEQRSWETWVTKTYLLERFKITFTANGNNDHVTMLALYMQLAVFSLSVKVSSFALASKIRIILHYSPICVLIFSRKHWLREISHFRLPQTRFWVSLMIAQESMADRKDGFFMGSSPYGNLNRWITYREQKTWVDVVVPKNPVPVDNFST